MLAGKEIFVRCPPKETDNMKRALGIPTTVIHAVKSDNVDGTEVQPLANYLIKVRYSGGDGGDAFVLVEGQGSVVHDGLIIIWRV